MNDITNRYQPPSAEVGLSPVGTGANPMGWKDIYFSFQGRIPRKTYWVWGMLGMIGFVIAASIVAGILSVAAEALAWVVMVPAYIVMVWAGFALGVKRWHDRNKSGWWVLIGFIPVIGAIWQLVENGFLRGTVGDNNYGPDPTEA